MNKLIDLYNKFIRIPNLKNEITYWESVRMKYQLLCADWDPIVSEDLRPKAIYLVEESKLKLNKLRPKLNQLELTIEDDN